MPQKVDILVEDFVGFIAEYASNISKGGMFLSTSDPLPIGSELDFDVRLEDGFTLIHGKAAVAWVRHQPEGARPAGMGVRFTYLTPESEALIDKMVANYVSEGGTPFDVEQDAPSRRDASGAAEPGSQSGAAGTRLDSEVAEAMKALGGESAPNLAPGLGPSAGLDGQEERTRAPKPSIFENGESPAAADGAPPAALDPQPAPDATAPPPFSIQSEPPSPPPSQAAPPAAVESGIPAPQQSPPPEPPAPQSPPSQPTPPQSPPAPSPPPTAPPTPEPRPPVHDLPVQESATESDGTPPEIELQPVEGQTAPPTEPDRDPSLSLDVGEDFSLTDLSLDDPDISIDFDRTDLPVDGLEEGDGATSASDGAEGAADDEPEEMPDLSETLGRDMVGAGTGFFTAMLAPEEASEAEEEAAEPELATPAEDLSLEVAEEEASGPLAVSSEAPELEPGPPAAEPAAEPVAEPAAEAAGEPPLPERFEEPTPTPTPTPTPVSRSGEELIDAGQLDDFLAGNGVEAPPAPAMADSRVARASFAPAKRRRPRRPGQLRRWTSLAILLALAAGVTFLLRDRGTDVLLEYILGPGSSFTVEARELVESAELQELDPPSLLELMEQEEPPVELVVQAPGRQRQVVPATKLENVTFHAGDQETVIVLWANGDFTPTSITWVRIDGEVSREVLQIRGIEEPYWIPELTFDSRGVSGLRFGHQVRRPFNELHLAIDLNRPRVRLRKIEMVEGRLLLTLQ